VAGRTAVPLLLRSAVLVVLTGALAAGLGSLCREPLSIVAEPVLHSGVPALARLSFEQVLTGGCALVLVICGLWLVLAVALAVVTEALQHLRAGRGVPSSLAALTRRLCPALIRTLVATVLGAVVTTTVTATVSTAVTAPAHSDRRGDGLPSVFTSSSDALSGLALPDRVMSAPGVHSAAAAVGRRTQEAVVVGPGDSLWSIAADLLPERAGDPSICVGWHQLYYANRDRIGPDPDLIQPGTVLVVPDLSAPRGGDQS
jgi:LysM domain